MFNCFPDDGGLYVPSSAFDFRKFFLLMDEKTNFNELAAAVAPSFIEECFNPVSASRVVKNAFPFSPELIKLDDNFSLLQLYNGPSGVFKDFGIAFMSALFDEFLDDNKKIMIISAAGSGAGISEARAFAGKKGINLVLVYPSGRICGLDQSAFVQNGGNILPVQIDGTLDDCQRIVSDAVKDREFSQRYNVTSSGSMNAGSLMPAVFYFLYAFIQIKNFLSGDFIFSIPCGNFSNLIAGLYAWKFGLPVNGFIAAMNSNNSMGGFFQGKPFIPLPGIATNSPALDVSVPLNYERLLSFCKDAPAVMRNMIYPYSIDDKLTLETIKKAHKKYGIFIDPHTAVAFAAAQKKEGNAHAVVLATGHPANSAKTINEATGETVKIPESFAALRENYCTAEVIPAHSEALKSAAAKYF